MNEPVNIFNWRRVDDRLTTSGQPTEEQLPALQQLGVTHIINLGMHDHERALPDEQASVTQLGIEYVHIPVAFDNPTMDSFDKFCEAISDIGDTSVHVHCIANLRVTAFLYKYWRDIQGVEESDARKLMDSVWRPGGVWAKFIGDEKNITLPHRPPIGAEQ